MDKQVAYISHLISVSALVGEARVDNLSSNAYQQLIPARSTTESWANTYPERHDSP